MDKTLVIVIVAVIAFLLLDIAVGYYIYTGHINFGDPVVGKWQYSTSTLEFYNNHSVSTNWPDESYGTWNKTGSSYQLDFNSSSSVMTYDKTTDKINGVFRRMEA